MAKTLRRRLLILLIGGVLLVLLVRVGAGLWAQDRLEVAVARIEQRHGPLTHETLVVPPVPAGENRAKVLRAAAALVDVTTLTDRTLGQRLAQLRQAAPDAPLPDDLRAFVDTNADALRLAADARARKQANWEADYVRAANQPPWLDLRTLSTALYLSARRHLDDGRADDAAMAIASGLALTMSVRQEPSLIAQLMRSAFGMQHFEAVQQLLTGAEPSQAALEELARWLAEDGANPMDLALRGELTLVHQGWTRFEQGDDDMGPLGRAAAWPLSRSWWARPVIRFIHAESLTTIGALLDVQMGLRPRPSGQPVARDHWFPPAAVANLAVPGLVRTMATGDLYTSQRGLTELAVALRRFRFDNGRYPDDLSALMSRYMASLPIDAATGRPPAYAREGRGFSLHAGNVTGQRAAALDWNVSR